MNRFASAAFGGALLIVGATSAMAQSINCQVDPSSWCSHAPADFGFPDSLCTNPQFQNTYQFASQRVCQLVVQRARQARQDWCSCAPEPLSGAFKRDCAGYARADHTEGEFCAGLPPRSSVNAAAPQLCHVDPGAWCQNPPADFGWPDSLCANTPNLTTPFASTQTCLTVTAQARNILQEWCACNYEPDPGSPLKPGCFFYSQSSSFQVPVCVFLAPRNLAEQQAELQRQAKEHLTICEGIKKLPADWTLGKGGMARDQYYAACVSNAQSELNAAQTPPTSTPASAPSPGSTS